MPQAGHLHERGQAGCALYVFRFATDRETKLGALDSAFDEEWPTIWRHRVAFVWQYEWGADLTLSTLSGHNRLLVRMPGTGAEVFDLTAQGPTIGRHTVHWALSIGQEFPTFSELRGLDLKTGKEQRATIRIDTSDTRADRATTGFAQDGGVSWYVRVPSDGMFEIHRATGLEYEPAPPPHAPHG